jgi:flavodoxin
MTIGEQLWTGMGKT